MDVQLERRVINLFPKVSTTDSKTEILTYETSSDGLTVTMDLDLYMNKYFNNSAADQEQVFLSTSNGTHFPVLKDIDWGYGCQNPYTTHEGEELIDLICKEGKNLTVNFKTSNPVIAKTFAEQNRTGDNVLVEMAFRYGSEIETQGLLSKYEVEKDYALYLRAA